MSQAADRLGLPSSLPDFVEKDFAGQARALGIKSRGAAVDVVVARAARRELELAQSERLVGEQAQQILARGSASNLYDNMENRARVRARRPSAFSFCTRIRRGNLNILPQRSLRGMKLQSARKLFFFLLAGFLLANLSGSGLVSTAFAEGTRTWEQSKFDELTKGTATGVAIRSAGGLELAPTFKSLYATPSTYIWAIAADDAGNVYVAAGAPARVYRITPDGKATIIFEPKELQVQALRTGPGGAIYAATAPDGKVYKLEHKPGGKGQPAKGDPPQDSASGKDKRRQRERQRHRPNRLPIPRGVRPSTSSRARNISGTWPWTSPATFMLPPATTEKFIALRRRVSIRSSSRAMKPTSAFWPSMRRRI